MASISDIRQQYPQYNDMSDQQLADAMYKAHYSDMPRDQFNAKIGFSSPQQSTTPPSTWDKIVASPIGREINKAVIQPAASVLGQAGDMLNTPRRLMGLGPNPLTAAFSTAPMVASRAYDESVANNRNTPGYPAARVQADKVQASVPSGLSAQVTPGMNAMVPGLANMGGGMDAMNAAQDSAEAAQGQYKQAHPISSFLANMAGGLLLAPKLPEVGAMPQAPASPPNSNLRPMAQEAHDTGYVLPPQMMSDKPGPVANFLAGWSGKVKTAQGASEANQRVTNALAAKSLGLNPEDGISEVALRRVRADAGKAYGAVSKALPVTTQDSEFLDAIGGIGDKTSSLAETFPNITKNTDIENLVSDLTNAKSFKTEDGITLVRQLRRDATANFKAAADPSKLALAQAQRDAAEHVDDLIQRNLAQTGQEGLVSEYQAARQTIAKTYDLQSATNLATGNVNAHRLAALAARGRPLSGELSTIANSAAAFPKALQPLDRIGGVEPLSTLDLGAAALSAAHGHFGVGAAILGKPMARKLLLSDTFQNGMARGNTPLQVPRISTNAPIPLGLMNLPPLLLQKQQQPQG